MTSKHDKSRQSEEEGHEREHVKGGQESWPDTPGEAAIRGESNFGGRRGRRRPPDDELDFETDQSWGSE
jgi:hypothetical protein